MSEWRIREIIIGLFLVLVLVGLLHYTINSVKEDVKEKELQDKGEAPVQKSYNEYGLPSGTELSDKVIYESDKYLVYEDRVLCKYLATSDASEVLAGQIDNLRNNLDAGGHSDVGITILPIPLRILYDDSDTSDADKTAYDNHMQALEQVMAGRGNICNTKDRFDDLIGKKYVFYRTSESWTLIGAYYGYVGLCETLGIQPKDLEDAKVMDRNSFRGNEYRTFLSTEADEATEAILDETSGDPFMWLYSDTFKNREVLHSLDGGDQIKRPVIIHSVMGAVSVVGGSFEYAVAEGSGEGGIILVGDSSACALTPYLCESYKTVCVVNLRENGEFLANMTKLIDEYGVTEIVIAQQANRFGDMAYNLAINLPLNVQTEE